jgi:hypothetical protein
VGTKEAAALTRDQSRPSSNAEDIVLNFRHDAALTTRPEMWMVLTDQVCCLLANHMHDGFGFVHNHDKSGLRLVNRGPNPPAIGSHA